MKTYGTINLDERNKQWVISTEPHVALRLKRVFARIDKRTQGAVRISANAETSRDLEWFIQRYPHDVTPLDALQRMAAEHKESETVVQQLLNGNLNLATFDMKLPPREYQVQAAQMWRTVGGLLLGDDTGVGKSCSALTGMVQPGMLPGLIVTLTHLPRQWVEQVEMFTGLSVHIIKKGQPYDFTKEFGGKFPDILISNYHKLSGWASTLSRCGLKSVAFDEGHELRHASSGKYAAAKLIADSVTYKIHLTATPIFNLGPEIFNLIEIIKPGALGTYEEFYTEWCVGSYGGKPKLKDPAAFGLYLRESGLMLRRTRKEIKRELEPVIIVPHTVDYDEAAFKEITGSASDLARQILQQTEDFKGQRMQAAGEFNMRMRQATGISKAPYVADFVKLLHESSGEKIVLFGWHRECYKIWLDKLKDLKPVMYTGSETAAQKEASKKAFVEGDSQVFIISLRSGAGLDGLQDVCHIGVVGELDWSPATLIQNTGRIHRDGQDESVIMYYLLSDHGSDPVMSDILGVKKQQLDGINSPTKDLIEELQVDADYIKKLARDFLLKRGEVIEEQKEEAA